jgi:hypothetical protein
MTAAKSFMAQAPEGKGKKWGEPLSWCQNIFSGEQKL